jgi:2-oxoisovalerate dehydrogenase E1 component
MPKQTQLTPLAPWVEIKTTPADWKKADPALLGAMLSQLHIIRAFEEKVLELAGEGLVHGPAHSSIGQEGGAVGSIIGLRPTDQVNGSHRGHHQFLAKALTYLAPDLTPMSELDDPLNDMLYRSLAEIMGLEPGYGHGRGGYSKVGKDALRVPQHQHTMLLCLDPAAADHRSIILHEFGHMLGLKHEHQALAQ